MFVILKEKIKNLNFCVWVFGGYSGPIEELDLGVFVFEFLIQIDEHDLGLLGFIFWVFDLGPFVEV